MKRRLSIFARSAALIVIGFGACATAHAQDRSVSDLPEATFQAIIRCLAQGNEVVMAPRLACVARQGGENSANSIAKNAHMPLGEPGWDGDWGKVCADKNDPRRLPANVIKRIVANKEAQIAPSGIRIIGAVFCGSPHGAALDLAGLDLAYSLVIDRSVVNGYLDARNLRIKGDLSFDEAVILESVRLNRARVEGSVYGKRSFMEQLFVSDTQVNGSWTQPNSVVFSDAQFLRANISGDLSIEGSAFSWLRVLSSHIAGTIDLNDSEARCGYHLTASTAGYLTASQAGFGIVKLTEPPGAAPIEYPWWNRRLSGSPPSATQRIFESPAIAKLAAAEVARIGQPPADGSDRDGMPGCDETTRSQYPEFYVFDSSVQAAFCLTSFAWLAPRKEIPDDAHPTSIIALNGSKIDGNLIINLWGDQSSSIGQLTPEHPDYKRVSDKHKFEAIGLTAGALIFDFSDNTRPYFTYLDGLKFERVHKATPNCTNQSGAKLASQVELPKVDDVLAWLNKNAAHSSQPFAAFVSAFERAGESATRLRINSKTIDLCEKTTRWIQFIERFCPGHRLSYQVAASPQNDPVDQRQTNAVAELGEIFSNTGEVLMIGFQWMLFLLADHGLRPAKVVWSVAITLWIFSIWFWLVLGIVGFEPKREGDEPQANKPPLLWPISVLFLFDRMIPLYRIRDEHYSIAKVYRRATPAEIDAGAHDPEGPPYTMRYLGQKYSVSPASEEDLRRAEKWLVVLRIMGVVFIVFLLAAINEIAR
jgi:hypothetical protein